MANILLSNKEIVVLLIINGLSKLRHHHHHHHHHIIIIIGRQGQTQFYDYVEPPRYAQKQYSQPQSYNPQNRPRSHQAGYVCKLCGAAGHYDSQCEFAFDFLNRTTEAFRTHYTHDASNQDEWSPEDNNDSHNTDQPFQ